MGAMRDPDYDALMALSPDLLKRHVHQFALMHRREVVGFFRKFSDALNAGRERFAEGDFTVQEVRTKPVRLGVHSALI
jgi:hypothetical protein